MTYTLKTIDNNVLQGLRHQWCNELSNEDEIFRLQSSIDTIANSVSYGDAVERSGLSTFMAVVDKEGAIFALVEIINSEIGKTRVCKIMDFIYAPAVENTEDDIEYMNIQLNLLLAALRYVLNAVKEKGAGYSKIYARDDAAKNMIESIEKLLKNKETQLGLSVKTEGRRWLKFEPTV